MNLIAGATFLLDLMHLNDLVEAYPFVVVVHKAAIDIQRSINEKTVDNIFKYWLLQDDGLLDTLRLLGCF